MSIRAAKQRKHYSPATEAQIKHSMPVAAQIQGEGMHSLRETLDMFLRRDPGRPRAHDGWKVSDVVKTHLLGPQLNGADALLWKALKVALTAHFVQNPLTTGPSQAPQGSVVKPVSETNPIS